MKKLLVVAFLLAGAPLLAASMTVTKKFDWAPQNGIQVLDWSENGIMIKQVSWDLGDIMKPLRTSTCSAIVTVDNDSAHNVVPGIAIAVFDDEDHLIAAGDGGVKMGNLGKGERDHFHVSFSHVFRNLDHAKYFYVTLETK